MSAGAMPVALLAGSAAALLQFAGGLKTASPLAALPVDLTLAAAAMLLPALALLAVTRRWHVEPVLALPLAAALLLPLWLVVAGSWTVSRDIAPDKLVDVVVGGPLMLAAGLLVGAEPVARRALGVVSLLAGLLLAASFVAGAADGSLMRDALAAEGARANYQIAGLGMAVAAGLAAVRAAEAPAHVAPFWLAMVALLAAAALLPGGRMALLALGCGVALAPALRLGLGGRGWAATGWCCAMAMLAVAFLAAMTLQPERAEGLRTLERLTGEAGGLDVRMNLWSAALDQAGEAAPFGLGTGGFPIAAGFGERRGLYPHNHALEALVEGGLPGFLLWLLGFGGGIVAALLRLHRADPAAAARIAAMVLPVAMATMVSSDLGNRMAWFALGLALSLGLAARPPERAHV
jgi:O-antigen ligase